MPHQVDFYLLGQSDAAARFTYACRIANKAYHQGMKIYMQTNDESQSAYLDRLLWTFSQESFVPHACRNGETSWQQYPVQIGTQSSQNNKDNGGDAVDLLISLSNEAPKDYQRYDRIADLIPDDPDQKQWGRLRFKFYRDQGIEPKTHHI